MCFLLVVFPSVSQISFLCYHVFQMYRILLCVFHMFHKYFQNVFCSGFVSKCFINVFSVLSCVSNVFYCVCLNVFHFQNVFFCLCFQVYSMCFTSVFNVFCMFHCVHKVCFCAVYSMCFTSVFNVFFMFQYVPKMGFCASIVFPVSLVR